MEKLSSVESKDVDVEQLNSELGDGGYRTIDLAV